GGLTIEARRPHHQASTFLAEVVVARLGDGSERQLFCKFGGGPLADVHGHKGGVPYEAHVYRRVLAPAGVSVPEFVGSHVDPDTGLTWLVLEYLDGVTRMHLADDSGAAAAAAASWIGAFHRLVPVVEDSGLTVY